MTGLDLIHKIIHLGVEKEVYLLSENDEIKSIYDVDTIPDKNAILITMN